MSQELKVDIYPQNLKITPLIYYPLHLILFQKLGLWSESSLKNNYSIISKKVSKYQIQIMKRISLFNQEGSVLLLTILGKL